MTWIIPLQDCPSPVRIMLCAFIVSFINLLVWQVRRVNHQSWGGLCLWLCFWEWLLSELLATSSTNTGFGYELYLKWCLHCDLLPQVLNHSAWAYFDNYARICFNLHVSTNGDLSFVLVRKVLELIWLTDLACRCCGTVIHGLGDKGNNGAVHATRQLKWS